MVIGLAPVFLCWRWTVAPWAFHAAVGIGLLTGIVLLLGCPPWLLWFEGKYGDYLSLNLLGTALCFGVFGLARLFPPRQPMPSDLLDH